MNHVRGEFGSAFAEPGDPRPPVSFESRSISSTELGHGAHQWVLQPNQSISWRQTKIIFVGVALVLLSTAFMLALLGFWPVLPFAGAELFALGVAMVISQRRGAQVEVVALHGDSLLVEKGRRGPEERWAFQTAWVQVLVRAARIAGHPSRLSLRSHGVEVPVGDFLVEEERQQLARDLRGALARANRAVRPDSPGRHGEDTPANYLGLGARRTGPVPTAKPVQKTIDRG